MQALRVSTVRFDLYERPEVGPVLCRPCAAALWNWVVSGEQDTSSLLLRFFGFMPSTVEGARAVLPACLADTLP